jgi:hypothetical protein
MLALGDVKKNVPLSMTGFITEDALHRAIDCPTCRDNSTKLQAWASEDGFDRMEVDS